MKKQKKKNLTIQCLFFTILNQFILKDMTKNENFPESERFLLFVKRYFICHV